MHVACTIHLTFDITIVINYRIFFCGLLCNNLSETKKNSALRIEAALLRVQYTTDDDCEQQVRTSHFVYNTWPHRRRDDGRVRFTTAAAWCQVKQEAIVNICTYYRASAQRVSTLTRDIDIAIMSVRHTPVLDENGWTYRYSFFTTR